MAALECIGQFSGGPHAAALGAVIAGTVAVTASLVAIGTLRRTRAAYPVGLATAGLYALYCGGLMLLGEGSGSFGLLLAAFALASLSTTAARSWYGPDR
jgi:hypothetical protein